MSAERPYTWPKSSGTLTAPVIMDYASWLFPKLSLEWEAPGVIKRKTTTTKLSDEPQRKEKPYQFRKSKGWLNLQKDVRPFAAYVLRQLKPWCDRKPFTPARKEGMALVEDLQALDTHVQIILRKKKEEQSCKKP